ncbi:MAG TPA: addiction module protein [Thermoanaerobaculia bacterium]|nr:addiction module protein [Thermoanaerobaculia bacterium]
MRGKHTEAYRQGYVVKIHRPNGEVLIIPSVHLDELDRRLAELEDDPDAGSSWEEVKARLERGS